MVLVVVRLPLMVTRVEQLVREVRLPLDLKEDKRLTTKGCESMVSPTRPTRSNMLPLICLAFSSGSTLAALTPLKRSLSRLSKTLDALDVCASSKRASNF